MNYVLAAYAIAGVVIGGYAVSLVLRRRDALREWESLSASIETDASNDAQPSVSSGLDAPGQD